MFSLFLMLLLFNSVSALKLFFKFLLAVFFIFSSSNSEFVFSTKIIEDIINKIGHKAVNKNTEIKLNYIKININFNFIYLLDLLSIIDERFWNRHSFYFESCCLYNFGLLSLSEDRID